MYLLWKKRGQGCPFKSTAPITTCSSKGAILAPFFLVWNCFPVWPCLNHYFWLENIPFILLSPVKTSSCLNQERSMHRSAVYKQKQTRRVLNKFRLVLWPEASVTPPGSAPSHRAGLVSGMPAREAGALPRRLKNTASSINCQSASFWGQGSEVYTQQPLLAYIPYTMIQKTLMDKDWITCGLLWCFYQLFGLILTVPIHHRGFFGEQVMKRKISQNLFWWRNKLIYILDDLRTSTSLISTLNLHWTWNIPLLAYLLGMNIHTPFHSL